MTLKLNSLSFVGLTAILALILGAGVASSASALDIYEHKSTTIGVQENLQYGIGVSPVRIQDVSLTPGQRYEGTYSIFNEGQNDISVVILISPFSYSADYQNVDMMTSSSYNQIQEWVQIDRGPIPLKSGELKVVPFAIDVPLDIRGGGQYFTFINRIEPGSEPDERGGMVGGVKQIGLTVGTRVDGEGLDVCGKVIAQEAKFWQSSAPLVTSATIENCGNVDFVAHGYIKVENALFGGGLIYETPSDKGVEIRVLPNGEHNVRTKEINWDGAPVLGLFNVTQDISIGNKIETIKRTVLILPLWVILTAILIIVLIVMAIVVERRVAKKRRIKTK